MTHSTPLLSESDYQDQLESLMEAAGDIVVRINNAGKILYVSRRSGAMLSQEQELVGTSMLDLVASTELGAFRHAMTLAVESGRPSRVNARIKGENALTWIEFQLSAYRVHEDGAELLAVGRDISNNVANEERLRYMATHDALTGLPNRTLLSDRIRMAIAQSHRSGLGFSVAALDLDGFKKVNDVLGHPVGDGLLRVAGTRLNKTLRESDTLARVGGDEFIAIMHGAVSNAEIKLVSGRLIASLQSPFDVQGHTLHVSASVGVAVYPDHGDDEVKLLANADAAMYRAKETGKARCVIYNREQITPPEYDISLEAAMFQAVRDGEFLLHYQPIVDSRTRQIKGFETLMRWMRPGVGLIPPVRFIPIAESNGLISLLGAWALKAACVQLKAFQAMAGRRLYISVNVSPRQFRNEQFLDVLDEAIAYSGIDGDQLLLEITEGTLMLDPLHAESILNKIVARNAGVAIDDFGTGYSSLAYLKRFPIACLKIDRAFIKDLPASEKDAAICNAVLGLAKSLNLSVVAEGVETEEQFAFLAARDCTYIQGYLTGKPMPPQIALEALDEASFAALRQPAPRQRALL